MILFCFGLTEAVTMALSFIGIWINDYIIPCVCVCTDTGDLAEKKSQKLTRVRVEKSTWNQSSRDASWQQRSTCKTNKCSCQFISLWHISQLLIQLVPQTRKSKSKCINRTKQEWTTVLKWLWCCLLRIIKFCVLPWASSESDDIQTSP